MHYSDQNGNDEDNDRRDSSFPPSAAAAAASGVFPPSSSNAEACSEKSLGQHMHISEQPQQEVDDSSRGRNQMTAEPAAIETGQRDNNNARYGRSNNNNNNTSTSSSSTRSSSRRKKRWWRIRLFRGMINDVKRRAPYYWSDWTEAWDYRVVPATVYMYFAKYGHTFAAVFFFFFF